MRMATRIDHYWSISGLHKEASHWLDLALSASTHRTPDHVPALGLSAWYAALQGDRAGAGALMTEAVALARELGAETEGAFITLIQGAAAVVSGNLDAAVDLLEPALATLRAAGAADREHFALLMLGLSLGARGERDRGLDLLGELSEQSSRKGELFWRGYALWAVALVELAHGEVANAEAAARESVQLHFRMNNSQGAAFAAEALSCATEQRGGHARAAVLSGIAAAVWHRIGTSPFLYAIVGDANRQCASSARAALGSERYESAFRQGLGLAPHDAVAYALETGKATSAKAGAGPHLTPRERQVAEALTDGASNKEIAAKLFVSPRTVETHVQNILAKTGLTSRTDVASWLAQQ
jgi:non-specific serine/threonine protein kinase